MRKELILVSNQSNVYGNIHDNIKITQIALLFIGMVQT